MGNLLEAFRAAVALNEDRVLRKPKMIWPPLARNTSKLQDKSCIQAWFIGTHVDMDSLAERDGLALYPLQWMMLESQARGLNFRFDSHNCGFGGRARLENPLEITDLEDDAMKWLCKTQNGIEIRMRDIRHLHDQVRYEIQLKKVHRMRTNLWRNPYDEGDLRGWCRCGKAICCN